MSADPRKWPVADAQSIQHRAKVGSAARNYRLCASGAAHVQRSGELPPLETRSDNKQPFESQATCDCESRKLLDKTLQSSHRLQLRWEGSSGVPGVVSMMQCGYCQCHGPQLSSCVQKSWRSGHYLRSRGAHSS